jgi:hypothetical protein
MPVNSSPFMAASRILYLFSVLSSGEIFVPHFGQSKSPFPLIFVRSTLNNLLVCNLISLQILLVILEPKFFTEQCSNRSFFRIRAVSQKTVVRSSSFLDVCKSFQSLRASCTPAMCRLLSHLQEDLHLWIFPNAGCTS